ncbi:MAG: hypothetical protein RXO54_07505 [Acidilobus sp.]
MLSQLRRSSMPFYAMVAAVVAWVLPVIGPKARAGQLGESVVSYMAAEAGRQTSG